MVRVNLFELYFEIACIKSGAACLSRQVFIQNWILTNFSQWRGLKLKIHILDVF